MPSEQGTAIICAWYFLLFTWVGFYSSLMLMLFILQYFIWLSWPLSGWWMVVGVYIAAGFGLWKWRMVLLRAMVEGPQAHPWFQPIRLFFSLSIGTGILIAAIGRIFLSIVEQTISAKIADLILLVPALWLSLLFLGLAMISGITGWLHYQKGKGSNELRV